MEYFNTFGGGTAACAAALATLRAVKEDGLQAHADEVSKEEIVGFAFWPIPVKMYRCVRHSLALT